MNKSNEEIYKGNNSSNYQPPTGNPQTNSTSLQTGVMGVQTSDIDSDIAQQRLPSTNNLKVITIQDSRSTTRAEIYNPPATQTWVGPFWGCLILVSILLTAWVIRLLMREQVPNITEVIEEAVKEPVVIKNTPNKTHKRSKHKTKKSKKKK